MKRNWVLGFFSLSLIALGCVSTDTSDEKLITISVDGNSVQRSKLQKKKKVLILKNNPLLLLCTYNRMAISLSTIRLLIRIGRKKACQK
jgi:hypothetical protein